MQLTSCDPYQCRHRTRQPVPQSHITVFLFFIFYYTVFSLSPSLSVSLPPSPPLSLRFSPLLSPLYSLLSYPLLSFLLSTPSLSPPLALSLFPAFSPPTPFPPSVSVCCFVIVFHFYASTDVDFIVGTCLCKALTSLSIRLLDYPCATLCCSRENKNTKLKLSALPV